MARNPPLTHSHFAPLVMRLRRQPFSLANRPYLSKIYDSTARQIVIRASRQVEKSTFIASKMLFDAWRSPGTQMLFIAPRYDQARLFSATRLGPAILESPILRRLLWRHHKELPVFDIPLDNGSQIFIRACFRSADACRGISADELFIDEYQDAAPNSLEVLRETMSHSQNKTLVLTGTPKLAENQLETAFRRSTGNEWQVPCPGCTHRVLMNEKALAPAGLICPDCQHPLDVRTGIWVSRNPASQWGEGFTLNHLMVPWLNTADVLERQQSYDRVRFVNEVLGLPVSLGDHVVTREELEACCDDRRLANSLADAAPQFHGRLVAGIDWGGGTNSGTVLVIGHLVGNRHFNILRFDRWLPHTDPNDVLRQVGERCRAFQISLIAADGGGNGQVYNRLLFQQLTDDRRRLAFFSIHYSAHQQDPGRDGILIAWTIDRTRNIGALFTRIKSKLISFPRVEDSATYLDEFVCELAEYDDVNRCVKYTKPETECDDALHATVYAEVVALRMAARSA